MNTHVYNSNPKATVFGAVRKYGLAILAVCMVNTAVFAQDEEPAEEEESAGISFSGSVDAYFRQNLTAPNELGIAPGSSFANQPGFALGMANLVIAGEKGNVGFVADLVYGQRGRDAVFGSNDNGSAEIVNQLYAYWNASDNVTFTIGNFNTFLGYEVISPTANFNYSTSYMFSNGPFSHTGLKADFALSDNLSAMLAVMNPTDATDFNPAGTYTLGAQLGYATDNGSAYLNFVYGDQDGKLDEKTATIADFSAGSTFQVDLTTGWDLSDKFYAGLNTTYNTTSGGEYYTGSAVEDVEDADAYGFLGAALYLQYAASDNFSIGLRPEYFSTYVGDDSSDITAITLSANASVGALTFIPEIRMDSASEDIFMDTDRMPASSLSSFVLGAVYSF